MARRAFRPGIAMLPALLLGGCDNIPQVTGEPTDSAVVFPKPDRPVAEVVSNQFSNEDARDERGEAQVVMEHVRRLMAAGVAAADIGVITPYNAQVGGVG